MSLLSGGYRRKIAFTQKYIFPGGYIPALSEMIAGSEGTRLMVTDVEVLRLHYGLTIRQWYKRTMAHRAEIVALYDERFFRLWTFYLAGAAAVLAASTSAMAASSAASAAVGWV